MKTHGGNTIKHIALSLGLSTSTVSRALNDHPYIHEETKKKVREEAEKVGYRHNALAANLRRSKSNTIGLIIPRISTYFHSSVITAIQNKLHDEGYGLIICQSNESIAIEKELVNTLFTSRVEGLIVAATLYTTDFSHFDIFPNSNIPILFYDRIPKSYSAHVIQGDDYRGSYSATSHLLQQGCKKIAFICGPLSCNLYANRYDGYLNALKKFNVELDENIVFFQELNVENAIEAVREIFKKGSAVDGVFACNDTSAIEVVRYAKQLKLRIPHDLKIVGYTNDPRTEIIEPAITSVEQFPNEVGLQAAGLMIDIIKQKIKPGKNFISVTTPIELVLRDSSLNI